MTLVTTIAVLGVAAFVHMVRYALLIINRDDIAQPVGGAAGDWLGVAVSVAAIFMVVAERVLLTNWLIARRSAAFAHAVARSRPLRALRADA